MEFVANEKKSIEIEVNNEVFLRHAVKTHYIKANESYIDIIEKYVVPIYQKGDFISISEKIIALCQNRIIYKKDLKLSFWAKFLSKFVNQTPAGEAVGNPYKMQIAINICGLPKVLYAAICAGIGKIFKKKGIFYDIVGDEVSGLDGFCADAFEDYLEMAILIPKEPEKVCNEIYSKLGVSCMIVDANDLNVEIYAKSDDIKYDKETLCKIIKDNPAGQANQTTPIILIRKKENII